MTHEHGWHDEGGDETTVGAVLGIRIVEDEGAFYLAEAEIAPYVDEPSELGVTLVFHPLDGLDLESEDVDVDWPSWPLDIDEDLSIDEQDSLNQQFMAIVRQLHGLGEAQVRAYLRRAREEASTGELGI